jgi:hypothetical protein
MKAISFSFRKYNIVIQGRTFFISRQESRTEYPNIIWQTKATVLA